MKRLFFVPKFLSLTGFFLLAAVCSVICVKAQDTDQPPNDVAPPPLTVLSKDEKAQLSAEDNIKRHTMLSIELMENRLKNAEAFVEQNKFQETINELGGFQAVLDSALNYLTKRDNGSNKIDYNFKRLEIGLRQTISRLEIVRRGLPYKYGYYVLKLQKYVREARAKAIEPLFSDSVVPESKLQPNSSSNNTSVKIQ